MRSGSSSSRSGSSRGLVLGAVMAVLALLVAGVAGESADLYAVQCAKVRTTVHGGVGPWGVGMCEGGGVATFQELIAQRNSASTMTHARGIGVREGAQGGDGGDRGAEE